MKLTTSQLKQIIKEEILKLNEISSNDKVYINNGQLWLSYAPNSGFTIRISGRKYITDKPGDKNYDSRVSDYIGWSKHHKPIKKSNAWLMYKIPEYAIHNTRAEEYDIWGGIIKPNKYVYLLITISKKFNVITLFYSKQEALGWIKSTS